VLKTDLKEIKMSDTDVATTPTKDETDAQTKTEPDKSQQDKEQWDKDRQRIDQAEADARRAREDADTAIETLAETRTELAEVKAELAKGKQVVQAEKDKLENMDPDVVPQSVINNLKRLEERNTELQKRNEALETKAQAYEEAQRTSLQEAAKNTTIERVLKECDDEFGAKFRNDAYKLADELVDSGKEKKPKDVIEAMRLMRKCYKQVSETKPETTNDVPADSGGGSAPPAPETRKSGSRTDVLADMKKTGAWKT